MGWRHDGGGDHGERVVAALCAETQVSAGVRTCRPESQYARICSYGLDGAASYGLWHDCRIDPASLSYYMLLQAASYRPS